MSKQDVLKFWEKVNSDPQLAKKLEAGVKPGSGWDAVVAFAGANGYKFTTADYGEAVKSLPKAIGNDGYKAWKKGEKVELGDKELEQVAGGVGLNYFSNVSSLRKSPAFSFGSPLREVLQPFGRVDARGIFVAAG
jgi:predicted ribosomally synthesized peptide with nif11-like leader